MRPAVLLLTREEVFACTTKRYGFSIKYTTAARNDGRISAVDIDILIDGGAYTSSGPAVARRACFHAPGPYSIPNVRSRARCAFTNNPVCGPMRGFGVPQTTWAHETQVDILARRLGMDPFEIRKLNALKPGLETTCGQRLDSAGLIETLEMARHKYAEIFRDEPVDLPDGLVRGVGVASMYYGIGKTGASFPSTARVELHPGGKVRVFICAADIGQGSDQALTQIAAHALGVPFDQIELLTNDTDLCPDGGPTVASRLTYDAGNAVLKACEEARRLERSGQNQASAPICSSATFRAATSEPDQETGRGVPWPTYAFATQVAEVAVNPKTGETSVLRVVAAHDVGRAVNPSIVTSQIEGGVVMGTGFALMEEFRPGITGGFREYMIPGALDAPPVCSIIVEDPEPTGPFGAKGVAEPSLIPTAPAITNAIYDAVSVRIKELPATPERLYGELRQRAEIAE
jgi:CO/xanthine dehydrogenase Mo-binding subunit